MGLHAMYDSMKRNPPPPPVPKWWYVEFTDPDTGRPDRYEYATEKDAEHEANKLAADGIPAVVVYRPYVPRKAKL